MIAQIALSIVLLIGAGLFVRTLGKLQQVDVGFDREHLLLFRVNAETAGRTPAQALAHYEWIAERIAGVPGVKRATFSRIALIDGTEFSINLSIPGYTPANEKDSTSANAVGPDFFSTLGIPVLLGRDFTVTDDAAAPKVLIVNQAFAERYLGEGNVVGRQVGVSGPNTLDATIVGVVRDAQYSDVKGPMPPTVYLPYRQSSVGGMANFSVRTTRNPAEVVSALRAAVLKIDATVPLVEVRTQTAAIDRLLAKERMFATLSSCFGLLALALAAVGLYGLMSYLVVRRTGEIGLRMALGAPRSRMLAMILGESLRLIGIGMCVGFPAAWAVTRLSSGLYFGLSTVDPLTYTAVGLLLMMVALGACWLPAWRAARVDPMVALRSE